MEEDAFKAMKLAKHYLLDDKVSDDWKAIAKTKMYCSNTLKYAACEHAHQKLLSSHMTVAEATGDPYWGTRLNVAQTLDCLPKYWPGKNIMGEILMELCACIQAEQDVVDEPNGSDASVDNKKWKAVSPLGQNPKTLKV